MKHFGKWLRDTRIKCGMTQASLAQSVGVTGSYISHLEHGDFLTREGTPSRPAVEIIDAIAQALGVSSEEARLAAAYISLLEGEKALTKKGYPIRPSLHLVDAIACTLGTSREEARLAAGYAPLETTPSALHN